MSENPLSEYEKQDTYFNSDEEDVLHEAYAILYDYGYTHDDLAPLMHLIAETTNYGAFAFLNMERDDE